MNRTRQTLDWETALRSAGDDFYIVTKFHRGMIEVNGKVVPRERVVERSIVQEDGTKVIHQDLVVVKLEAAGNAVR